MGIVLSVTDLSFSYEPGQPVWSGVSVDVRAGEALSILGPNGTGKSTLMRCMANLITPDAGKVIVDGTDIRKMGRRAIARAIAFVPQLHNPVFAFTALDVVVMGRTAHLQHFASPSPRDYSLALEAMDTFGISHLADKSYNNTSGGERQLILFARAVAQEARILLLDEPTSHLDFGNQARTLELVNGLAEQGLAVVMTTHFPDHALAYSKRTVLIAEGRMLGYGLTDHVVGSESLSRLYGLNVEIVSLQGGGRTCVVRKNGE